MLCGVNCIYHSSWLCSKRSGFQYTSKCDKQFGLFTMWPEREFKSFTWCVHTSTNLCSQWVNRTSLEETHPSIPQTLEMTLKQSSPHSMSVGPDCFKYKLYKPHSTAIRSNFFCVHVIDVWNNLYLLK